MASLSEYQLETLSQIALEEDDPGAGLISKAHCDEAVELGLAVGNFDAGYKLTGLGRETLAASEKPIQP